MACAHRQWRAHGPRGALIKYRLVGTPSKLFQRTIAVSGRPFISALTAGAVGFDAGGTPKKNDPAHPSLPDGRGINGEIGFGIEELDTSAEYLWGCYECVNGPSRPAPSQLRLDLLQYANGRRMAPASQAAAAAVASSSCAAIFASSFVFPACVLLPSATTRKAGMQRLDGRCGGGGVVSHRTSADDAIALSRIIGFCCVNGSPRRRCPSFLLFCSHCSSTASPPDVLRPPSICLQSSSTLNCAALTYRNLTNDEDLIQYTCHV